jgi:predicted transcriptional regulator|tara:strand:- start:175 stop:336 length:162 start_codon:yes stop_codon:yes gene_type:complete
MPIENNKVPRITRSYRVKPELDRRFTQATEKDARVKSRIIEQAVERYCVASGI